MGFFNLYKPKKYGYRFIYYDPKKEAQKEREKRLAEGSEDNKAEFKSSIQRGSFRKQAEKNKNVRGYQARQSNIRLVIILFVLLALLYYFLK
ncbi:MAG TPA: hypothetical protein VIK55_11440 [Paludibacter sp.]